MLHDNYKDAAFAAYQAAKADLLNFHYLAAFTYPDGKTVYAHIVDGNPVTINGARWWLHEHYNEPLVYELKVLCHHVVRAERPAGLWIGNSIMPTLRAKLTREHCQGVLSALDEFGIPATISFAGGSVAIPL